jgi:PRC-barrel domain
MPAGSGRDARVRLPPDTEEADVFEAENIRDWRGHAVVDVSGDKVGELESVYVDTATDQPSFAAVKTGIIGLQRITFVPLDGATVAPGYLRVRADKKTIKKAPAIDTDGELLAELEPEVFQHYGLDYQPGATGERRLARR